VGKPENRPFLEIGSTASQSAVGNGILMHRGNDTFRQQRPPVENCCLDFPSPTPDFLAHLSATRFASDRALCFVSLRETTPCQSPDDRRSMPEKWNASPL
jgi:hypothetical protein